MKPENYKGVVAVDGPKVTRENGGFRVEVWISDDYAIDPSADFDRVLADLQGVIHRQRKVVWRYATGRPKS